MAAMAKQVLLGYLMLLTVSQWLRIHQGTTRMTKIQVRNVSFVISFSFSNTYVDCTWHNFVKCNGDTIFAVHSLHFVSNMSDGCDGICIYYRYPDRDLNRIRVRGPGRHAY